MNIKSIYLACILFILTGLESHAMSETACDSLRNIRLIDAVIHKTEYVSSGSITLNDKTFQVPHMCRVSGTAVPAINFEVWLPLDKKWNGRFQMVGGGGLAGRLRYGDMTLAVNGGYATAATDTGHIAGEVDWMKDRGRVQDFGYRAIHETAVQAKVVLAAYYGRSQDYAYFNGCSTGGRQGLMEVQRYPEDFNGVISGAPVNNHANLMASQLWNSHATLIKPGSQLLANDFSLITKAVLKKCDMIDGVKDGFLTDPRACDFDPSTLLCDGKEKHDCLTTEKVTALKRIYQGATNPRTGDPIYPGPAMGGEMAQAGDPGWIDVMDDKPFFLAMATLKNFAFNNDNYQWRDFDFDQDVDLTNAKFSTIFNAINPDISNFDKRGGKLIMYHGWSDAGVTPGNTINYYESLIAYQGKSTGSTDAHADTAEYARLYMMPGVGHCEGNIGPDAVDYMSAIVAWVEKGHAPKKLISRKIIDGKETMSRPICPYPQKAVYKGKGDTNKAGNFECK